MTTTNHYGEARDILNKTGRRRSGTSEHDLAAAQVHAMLAIADELRNIHNELVEMRGACHPARQQSLTRRTLVAWQRVYYERGQPIEVITWWGPGAQLPGPAARISGRWRGMGTPGRWRGISVARVVAREGATQEVARGRVQAGR